MTALIHTGVVVESHIIWGLLCDFNNEAESVDGDSRMIPVLFTEIK